MKEFNKKTEERIVCNDILNNKKKNLKVKKCDKKFFILFFISKL